MPGLSQKTKETLEAEIIRNANVIASLEERLTRAHKQREALNEIVAKELL